ncbi:MAG: SIMPL domain-containing protein, partial [Halobacteriales archaeon]|nr:SIMPL domain-containing protein [Halobacteriales archaeon]
MVKTDTVILVSAVVVAAAILGAGVAVGSLGTAQPATDDPRELAGSSPANIGESITVSASGSAETDPDEAVIRIAVTAVRDDATTARQAVARNVSSVREALTAMGLDDSQIRTVDFDLWEDRDRRPPEEDREPRTRYRASHDIEITVTDVDRSGEVIDAAIDNGATNIQDVRFTLSKETQNSLRQQALEDAMGNAQSQASTLAGSAEVSIEGVHSISTASRDPGIHPVAFEAADGGGGRTSINAGPVTVSASVVVTY